MNNSYICRMRILIDKKKSIISFFWRSSRLNNSLDDKVLFFSSRLLIYIHKIWPITKSRTSLFVEVSTKLIKKRQARMKDDIKDWMSLLFFLLSHNSLVKWIERWIISCYHRKKHIMIWTKICVKKTKTTRRSRRRKKNSPCRLKQNDRFSFLVLCNVVKCLYIITGERNRRREGEEEDDPIVTLSSFLLTTKEYTRI